jgi:hypothetical protein
MTLLFSFSTGGGGGTSALDGVIIFTAAPCSMSGAGATAAERAVDPEATDGDEGGEVTGGICGTAGTGGGSDAGGN